MRVFFGLLFLCCAAAANAEEDVFRFGVQSSLNSYQVDDPAGSTSRGSGLSLSGIALLNMGRESRLMFNLNSDSYSLSGTTSNVGQDVSSMGSSVSYQTMLRMSRTWKPWVGAGIGYASNTYKGRYTYTTPANQFKYLYADRNTTDISVLLNACSEWEINRDWDFGLQAQFAKSISDKSSTIRVGLYVVY